MVLNSSIHVQILQISLPSKFMLLIQALSKKLWHKMMMILNWITHVYKMYPEKMTKSFVQIQPSYLTISPSQMTRWSQISILMSSIQPNTPRVLFSSETNTFKQKLIQLHNTFISLVKSSPIILEIYLKLFD